MMDPVSIFIIPDTIYVNLQYRAKLRRADVHFLSRPVKDGTTGTVIVLTTPDAQRTMLAYPVSYLLLCFKLRYI